MVRFFIFLILIPVVSSAQLDEGFSDGDFTTSPQWSGTTEKFSIDESYMLQLTAPATESEAWLFSESGAIEQAKWSIRLVMDFNPSSNNLTRIYLAADAATVSEIKNALYIEIGQTTDDVCLYRQSGLIVTKLIDGVDDRVDLSSVDIKIEVTREDDLWTLKSDIGDGLNVEGIAEYTPKFSSLYFGIYCKYTSTRSNKFWFDDIVVSGLPYRDIDSPRLYKYQLINGENIKLSFSEPLDTVSISPDNFFLKKLNRTPSTVIPINGEKAEEINLYFDPALDDISNEEQFISGIKDLTGNSIKDTSLFFSYERVSVTSVKVKTDCSIELLFSKTIDENYIAESRIQITPGVYTPQVALHETGKVILTFDKPLNEGVEYLLTLSDFKDVNGDTILTTSLPLLYYRAKRYDVVFSEIMTDPSPSVGLPESEFVEIFNRSEYPLNIGGWRLMVTGKSVVLPEYVLNKGQEVMLYYENTEDDWQGVENKIALSRWLVLNNSSGEMVLLTDNGSVVDAIKYNIDQWGDGSFKQEGGWSFERIDVNNLSGSAISWAYSVDLTGGTPGKINSVKAALPDETYPEIKMITYENSDRVKLWFTESMDMLSDALTPHFKIKNSSATISEIRADTIFADNCMVYFSEKLKKNVIHEFSEISLTDNGGNKTALNSNRYFGLPDTISSNKKEIVINEILFNPRPDGYDFIEIFNKSQKIFNLSSLQFAESNETGGLTKLFPLTSNNILIFPDEYHVFTLSPQNIEYEYDCYDKCHLHQMKLFPAMPDDEGTVTISLNNGTITDRFNYNMSMHFPLLNSHEGVSLERISPETETDNPDNWHSTSADYGYATPTMENSQHTDLQKSDKENFTIEKELFTPNSDGYSDQLIINYSYEKPGSVASITIYNAKGLPVKELAKNSLLGTEGFITWDGTIDNGTLASPGIYIILVKTYNSTGETTTSKMICVVGGGSSIPNR